jgi:hypothetical protein
MYQETRELLKKQIIHLEAAIRRLGIESNILNCHYTIPANQGNKPTVFQVFLTNLTVNEATALIKLRYPEAIGITAENILPGISIQVK